eukprot:gene19522-biopygen6132
MLWMLEAERPTQDIQLVLAEAVRETLGVMDGDLDRVRVELPDGVAVEVELPDWIKLPDRVLVRGRVSVKLPAAVPVGAVDGVRVELPDGVAVEVELPDWV